MVKVGRCTHRQCFWRRQVPRSEWAVATTTRTRTSSASTYPLCSLNSAADQASPPRSRSPTPTHSSTGVGAAAREEEEDGGGEEAAEEEGDEEEEKKKKKERRWLRHSHSWHGLPCDETWLVVGLSSPGRLARQQLVGTIYN